MVRNILDDAVRRGLLAPNPTRLAASPRFRRDQHRRRKAWTAEELRAFLEATAGRIVHSGLVSQIASATIASMSAGGTTRLEARAALHRALGDPSRLAVVDALAVSDRTPGELRELTGLDWNLLGFHLRALEDAGVVERHASEGDRRRRYVRLRPGALDLLHHASGIPRVRSPLFVCTHNSARSQFAAALWRKSTGQDAASAGSDPARAVHPLAVEVAAVYDVDLSQARPRGFDAVVVDPDVVVTVCDRALEGGVPFDRPRLHWSVPDPSAGGRPTFERAFSDIADRLTQMVKAAT